jgi:hypothetical protein
MKVLLVLCLLVACTNAWRYQSKKEHIAFDIPSNVVMNMTRAQHNLHEALINYNSRKSCHFKDTAQITCTAYEYECIIDEFSRGHNFMVNLKHMNIIRDEIVMPIDERLQLKFPSGHSFTQFQKAVFGRKVASVAEAFISCTASQWKCEVSGASDLYEGFEVGYTHSYSTRPEITLMRALTYEQAQEFKITKEEFQLATIASFMDVIPDEHKTILMIIHSCGTFTPSELSFQDSIANIHESDRHSLEVCRKVGVSYRIPFGLCDEGDKCHRDAKEELKKKKSQQEYNDCLVVMALTAVFFIYLGSYKVVFHYYPYISTQIKTSVRNRLLSFLRAIHAKFTLYLTEEQPAADPQPLKKDTAVSQKPKKK